MSIVPCPSGGPARPPTPPNLADLRFRRKPAAGICGLGPSPRARGTKHGGDGGRRHGGLLEEEFAGGGHAPKTHSKLFSGGQYRERKGAVGAKLLPAKSPCLLSPRTLCFAPQAEDKEREWACPLWRKSLSDRHSGLAPFSGGVLANLVAHRKQGGFPTIGKKFSNGWKNGAIFTMIGKIFRSFPAIGKVFTGTKILS